MAFHFDYDLYMRVCVASYCLAGVSILISIIILGSAFYLSRQPHTRASVDRISFRLLCYAMLVQIVYDCLYIGIYAGTPGRLPSKICGVLVYIMLSAMGVGNWFCTCIAVNLMILIVFNLSIPRDKRWYIVTSCILGIGPPLIPAILGHFGRDRTQYGDCYMTEADPLKRQMLLIIDIYLWQLLSCAIATVATISVLITLKRSSMRTSRALYAGNPLNANTIPTGTLGTLNDRFVSIAIRISLYPIALVIINIFLTSADIVYTRKGLNTEVDWFLGVCYILLYGGRGIALGLLAIFVDPCLRRGLYALRHPPSYPTAPPAAAAAAAAHGACTSAPTQTLPTLSYFLSPNHPTYTSSESTNASNRGIASLPYTPTQPCSDVIMTIGGTTDSDPKTIETVETGLGGVPLLPFVPVPIEEEEAEKMYTAVESRL